MSALQDFDKKPNSMTEAIIEAAQTCRGRQFPEQFRVIIRDFLAQRFCNAIKVRPDLEQFLVKLFDDCTRR